jgi:3-oxoacyl-[acyl-carrier protein] reductase
MIWQKKGKILNISGYPGGASEAKGSIHEYVAKKAIEHFTAGLAEEVREHNIQVNCLSPILVATESLHRFFPEEVKDAILPEEIAKLSVFFLSEESDRVTGQIIVAGK